MLYSSRTHQFYKKIIVYLKFPRKFLTGKWTKCCYHLIPSIWKSIFSHKDKFSGEKKEKLVDDRLKETQILRITKKELGYTTIMTLVH